VAKERWHDNTNAQGTGGVTTQESDSDGRRQCRRLALRDAPSPSAFASLVVRRAALSDTVVPTPTGPPAPAAALLIYRLVASLSNLLRTEQPVDARPRRGVDAAASARSVHRCRL
jgi:hypothetical protein